MLYCARHSNALPILPSENMQLKDILCGIINTISSFLPVTSKDRVMDEKCRRAIDEE